MSIDYDEIYGKRASGPFNAAAALERQSRLLALQSGDDPATVYGERLLQVVRQLPKMGDVVAIIQDAAVLISNNANVNNQDKKTLMPPLHYAAAFGCRPLLRLLVNSGRCDYLLRDSKNRYAFEIAADATRDYAVVELLSKKQVRQAFERGVPSYELPAGRQALAVQEPR